MLQSTRLLPVEAKQKQTFFGEAYTQRYIYTIVNIKLNTNK